MKKNIEKFLFSGTDNLDEVLMRSQELMYSRNQYADYAEIMGLGFEDDEPSDEELGQYNSIIKSIHYGLIFNYEAECAYKEKWREYNEY